ncbi:hypothetical protein [Paenibacillus popilliae]|uniref:hypothetical protein n=1 Tax=Paenibacillus popilliae TaxID=78057 RepID=UPI0005AB88D3|nr:hypothetical protein [Paenibacillus popilliae]
MMKKFVLLALVLLLFVGNGNFTFAQQVGNEAQEIATLETKSAPICLLQGRCAQFCSNCLCSKSSLV